MSDTPRLPAPKTFITTHKPDGTSVFAPTPETAEYKAISNTTNTFADVHAAPSVPIVLDPSNESNDLATTTTYIASNRHPAGFPAAGPAIRYVDYAPGTYVPMHRTVSVDYGVVVAGTVELELDGGEKRTAHVGDMVVQRGTKHSWRNVGEGWARMLYVMLPAETAIGAPFELKAEFGVPGGAKV
ncbi:hypothetical protein EJ06DRAFT_531478 [Trichodelitschia bisporula]|uniref:Cupin type-2 domain-containing protein n=1 Tax=Trichodelitschia bisporula TaxID=703511 RepID=A0A6G1HTG2_9PEZI|nr:hypothetical protein EJ06DRAFT_531478 [Trichodelitschia bisporula]